MANSDECSICKELFQVEDNKSHLRCAHEFHTTCIDKWLGRKRTCPICRKRVDGEDLEENDNDPEDDVQADVELVERGNGDFVPRYIGEYRYHPETDSYMTAEEGVCFYLCWKFVCFLPVCFAVCAAYLSIQLVRRETFPYPATFISYSKELEILNYGTCIRNAGFTYWNDRLENFNGVAGRVPVRFLDFPDTKIIIQYNIRKEMTTGDILLQIGFIPTQFMDKDRFISEQGLAVTIVVRENEVRLVVSNFGVGIKEERLSGSKKGTVFTGMLVLRKERQNISVYLRVHNEENLQHERRELYFSTDKPYTRAPDGKYLHTFEYIYNDVEDLWPVFSACDKKTAVVYISSTLFHEPSCNKKIYISKDRHQITNLKQDGFIKCGHNSSKTETANMIIAWTRSKNSLYSYNPFMFWVKNYNFSFDLEFSKGLNPDTKSTTVFQLQIGSTERKFVIGLTLAKNHVSVIYWYNNSTIMFDPLPLKNSYGFKELIFTVEVNYHLNTVKTDVRDPAENKRYPHEFSNVVFHEVPHIYVGMTNETVMEACFH